MDEAARAQLDALASELRKTLGNGKAPRRVSGSPRATAPPALIINGSVTIGTLVACNHPADCLAAIKGILAS